MQNTPYFIKSALFPEDFPDHRAYEFVFVGASNSGKSTLINSLLGRKLCKTSSKPGHTSLINFFMVKKNLCFVDLPGYGFAKRSIKEQMKWKKAIEGYLEGREQLVLSFILFDLKRGLLKSDLELIYWLRDMGLPFTLLATKVDKLNQKERSQKLKDIKAFKDEFGLLQTSSLKNTGIKEIWAQIEALKETLVID